MVSTIFGVDEIRDGQGNILRQLAFGVQPDWEILGRAVANGDATLDFGGWDASLYDEIEISLLTCVPSSDGASLQVRVSIDGGATYLAGGSDYAYAHRRQNLATAPGQSDSGDDLFDAMRVSDANGTAAGESSVTKMFGGLMHGTGLKMFHFQNMTRLNDGTEYTAWGGCCAFTSSDVDGFRIFYSTGNIASGTFVVRGRRAAPVSFVSQDDWVVIDDQADLSGFSTHDVFWDDGAYDEIEVSIWGLVPSADNTNLEVTLSTDGSTFHTAASDYDWLRRAFDHDDTVMGIAGVQNTTEMLLVNALGTGTDEHMDVTLHLKNVANTTRKKTLNGTYDGISAGGTFHGGINHGLFRANNDALEGIRLAPTTGTLSADRIRVRGRLKTPAGGNLQRWTEVTIQTADATPVNIAAIPLAPGEAKVVRGFITGTEVSTANFFSANFVAQGKNNGGTSAEGAAAPVIDKLDASPAGAWDFDVDVDDTSDTIRLRVTGEAATTIDWKVQYEVITEDNV